MNVKYGFAMAPTAHHVCARHLTEHQLVGNGVLTSILDVCKADIFQPPVEGWLDVRALTQILDIQGNAPNKGLARVCGEKLAWNSAVDALLGWLSDRLVRCRACPIPVIKYRQDAPRIATDCIARQQSESRGPILQRTHGPTRIEGDLESHISMHV